MSARPPAGPRQSRADWAAHVRSWLVDQQLEPGPAQVAQALRSAGQVVGIGQAFDLLEEVRAELSGAGPLQDLLADGEVTDVLVNGCGQLWLDRGSGPQPLTSPFRDEDQVRRLAQRLAAAAGRRLDDAVPFVDARLPDGTRLHAALAPVAQPGTLISLRVPGRRRFDLGALAASGAIPADGLDWLSALVASRMSFLVCGGTGSGKTTVLGALLGLLPAGERLVVLEDSPELDVDHDHVCSLQARPPNVEGAGRIALSDLVRQAMRMRPDRIAVGEVRGPEVVDLLSALNTGHEGGCATLHANESRAVPARLEALALAAGMERMAAHSQMACGIEAVLGLGRRAGRRVVSELAGLTRDPSGLVRAEPVLEFGDAGVEVASPGHPVLARLAAAGPVRP